MYSIEQVRLLITYKENQLRELKNDSSASPIDIKKVEDDIKSLEIYCARLAMAKLLKLDGDENLQAANYEGIENNNPSSLQFRLSDDDVANFNSLRNNVNILRQTNNFIIRNVNDIANEVIEELVNRLNNMGTDEYNVDKEVSEELFKLLDLSKGEKHLPEIRNYRFAYDVSKKYPDAKIKLSSNAILELIELLDSGQEIEEEKYNDYLKMIISNINELTSAEQLSDEAKAILERINQSNYSLKIDLNNGINRDEIKFKPKDIEDLFKYLDENYDKLDEKQRDKLVKFLLDQLAEEAKDIDNVEKINKLIKDTKTKEFQENLRTQLSSDRRIVFADRHVSSSAHMIDEKIRKLEAKKAKYLGKKTGIESIDVMYKTKAQEIEKEIERLKQLKLSYDDNFIVSQLDERYNSRSAKIIRLEKEIKELQELKESLKTEFQKKRVEKRMQHLQRKITKLQKSQVRIEGVQKKIMTPKMLISMKRGMLERHFESISEIYDNYAEDYEKRAEKERTIGGMFSGIKAAFYEFKAGRYKSKSEMNKAIFSFLSRPETKVNVTGNTRKTISRNQVQALKGQMESQKQRQAQIAA